MEGQPVIRVAAGPQPSSVSLSDGTADRQPQDDHDPCADPPSARGAAGSRYPRPGCGRPREGVPPPEREATARDQRRRPAPAPTRSEEHTSELQSRLHLVCRLLLEKKKRT